MSETVSNGAPSVTLGGKKYPVRVLPFGVLKRCTVEHNEAGKALARGQLDDECMARIGFVVASGIDMPPDEFDQLPVTLTEVIEAYQRVAIVAGMTPKGQEGSASGEVAGGIGTPSTPT